MHKLYLKCAVVVAIALWGTAATADKLAESGRKIVAENRESVVIVRLVIEESFSFGGMAEKSESVSETTGTIIGEDGLTVASLTATNPTSMIEDMLGSMSVPGMQMTVDSNLKDVKILLDNGEEISADVVLRDRDLDLIFVRPKSIPPGGYQSISLTAGAVAEQFDQVVLLSRLGKVANRVLSGSFPRVKAVMQKPRKLYVISGMDAGAFGEPAFTLDGSFIGMTTLRKIKATGSVGGGMFGIGGMGEMASNMTSVIVPAADILEAAEQVPPPGEDE